MMRLVWVLAWVPVFMTFALLFALAGLVAFIIMFISGEQSFTAHVMTVCVWLPLAGAIVSSILAMLVVAWFEPKRNIQETLKFYPRVIDSGPTYETLEEVCISAGLEKVPELRLSYVDYPNAYTLGRSGEPVIIVTYGLLGRLGRNSLRAVYAHEVGHIINSDYSDMNNLYTVQQFIEKMQQRMMDMFSPLRNGTLHDGSIVSTVVSIILCIPVAIVYLSTKPISWFTRRCMSHERENLADANSVRLTRDPDSLARALVEIQYETTLTGATIRQLEIDLGTPLGNYIDNISFFNLLDGSETHPSTPTRLKHVVSMGAKEHWLDYAV